MGIDSGLLSRIETGKRYPPEIPALTRLAKVLGIDEQSDDFAALLAAADRGEEPRAPRHGVGDARRETVESVLSGSDERTSAGVLWNTR